MVKFIGSRVNVGVVINPPPPPPPPVSGYPAWRSGRTIGSLQPISNTSAYGRGIQYIHPLNGGVDSHIIDAWTCLARRNRQWWFMAPGGHGDWGNPVGYLDLGLDVPDYVIVDAGSTWDGNDGSQTSYTPNWVGPRYGDGRITSTHNNYSVQYLSGANAFDGVERILRVTDVQAYSPTQNAGYIASGIVNGWNIASRTYDAPGHLATYPYSANIVNFGAAICSDRNNGDVYLSWGDSIEKYTARTNTWSQIVHWATTPPAYPTAGFFTSMYGQASLVDNVRNRLVFLNGQTSPHQLVIIDLANPTVVRQPLSLNIAAFFPGLVHDLDNDRYIAIAGTFQNNGWPAYTSMYAINPVSFAITTIATNVLMGAQGVFGRLEYFPDLHGIAYMSDYFSDALFLPTA